jgi:hypothetical protein
MANASLVVPCNLPPLKLLSVSCLASADKAMASTIAVTASGLFTMMAMFTVDDLLHISMT